MRYDDSGERPAGEVTAATVAEDFVAVATTFGFAVV
jgi:hypothetical protein